MGNKEQPSYYGILPSEVRYAKIPPACKVLFAEITALSNQKGYCYASNRYFKDLYDVSQQTISGWITKLQKKGFISVKINGTSRYIETLGKANYQLAKTNKSMDKKNNHTKKTGQGYKKSSANHTKKPAYNTIKNNINKYCIQKNLYGTEKDVPFKDSSANCDEIKKLIDGFKRKVG